MSRTQELLGKRLISRRAAFVASAVGLLLIGTLFGVTRARVTLVRPTRSLATETVVTSPIHSVQAGGEALRIRLTNSGFTPAHATHDSGRFEMSVLTDGTLDDYTLRLLAQDGTVMSEQHVQKGSIAWSVNLGAGLYTLTVVGHQWSCEITVQ